MYSKYEEQNEAKFVRLFTLNTFELVLLVIPNFMDRNLQSSVQTIFADWFLEFNFDPPFNFSNDED